jgi:hypothetical protein
MLSRGRREDKRMVLIRRYGYWGKRFFCDRRPLERREHQKIQTVTKIHALKAKESGQKAAVQ